MCPTDREGDSCNHLYRVNHRLYMDNWNDDNFDRFQANSDKHSNSNLDYPIYMNSEIKTNYYGPISSCRATSQNMKLKILTKLESRGRSKYLFPPKALSCQTIVFHLTYTLLILALSSQSSILIEGLIIRIKPRDLSSSTSSSSESYLTGTNESRNVIINQSSEGTTRQANGTRSAKLVEVDAFGYLQRYGYVNESMANAQLISEDAFSDAVMTFQRFAGIPETGIVDQQTVKYMQMPRCGNKDMSGKSENGKRRKKRYALQGSKWRRQELTYRISQYPTKFLHKKHEVDRQIEKAFKIWSQVAPIDFVVKQDGRVHIDIRFASGEHGDGDPFDGPGNTLAHAYFPQYGGDAHFDDQEYWTVDSYAGTNIFQVAAHELGHSLGLGHSSVREALMAPFYQKYKPNFKLHPDDILGIQALYGERDTPDSGTSTSSTSTSTTTSTTTSTASPTSDEEPKPPRNDDSGWFNSFGGGAKPVDLCQESDIDTITRTEDGNTYVFKGQYYWQIKNEGLAEGYPARISRDWDGLPGNLDAALTWSDGKTFFFKGDKYWRFFNKRREPGYPKQISIGFAGIPNNIDAAFVWSGNGKTYFFKKDKYWRFDSKQDPPVSSQYPKSIRNWSGLPSNGIDAAFKWENGMTYFFKDDQYYRFDDREFEVDSSAKPQFPRSTAEWWFGCTNSNLPLKKLSNDTKPISMSSNDENEARHSSPDNHLPMGPQVKPLGNSLSRSIIHGFNSLFPSSSSSNSLMNRGRSTHDDWGFHRGLGEEVNKVFRTMSTRSVNKYPEHSINQDGSRSESGSPFNDNRWSFLLESHFKPSREQSSSELKLDTSAANSK